MKKLIAVLLLLSLCIPCFSACGNGDGSGTPTEPTTVTTEPTSEPTTASTSSAPITEEPTPTSEGLAFALLPDGSGYAVTDYAGEQAAVLVPDTHQGLPVTMIEGSAFAGARNVTTILLPDSILVIGSSAFTGCKSLAKIQIPAGVTYIGNYTFAGCEALTEITLPASLTRIGCYAFDRCKALERVTFPADTAWYRTYDPTAETGKETDVTDPEENADLLRDDWRTYYLKKTVEAEK